MKKAAMDSIINSKEPHEENRTSFGLTGVEPGLAEMLFLDYTISVSDVVKLEKRIKISNAQEIKKISGAIFDSFNTSLKEFENISVNSSNKQELLQNQIFEKLACWTSALCKPELHELLKINEYYRIPITEFPSFKVTDPSVIYNMVNNYVIDQDEYSKQISLSYYVHLLKGNDINKGHIGLPNNTILVGGPTGVGKTYAIQMLSRLFGKPFATSNCNNLVSEGIVGPAITDVFTDLYIKYHGNLSKIEQACIHFDEFDKLFESNSGVYNSRIINELLSIIDDKGEVTFKSDFSRSPESIKVSTHKMFFVFSGVFQKLPEIINKRIDPTNRSIGYTKSESSCKLKDLYRFAIHEDYQKAGVKPEIMGRINSLTYVNELSSSGIKKILLSRSCSPLLPFFRYFLIHNVQIKFSEDGAEAIAEHVVKNRLGARGIKSVLNKLLNNEMFDIHSNKDTILINDEFVNNKFK